jgi:hypothetical protein
MPGGVPGGIPGGMPGIPGVGMAPQGGGATSGLTMPPPLSSMMYSAGRSGEINPVLAKQQAEALGKMRAQQLDAQAAVNGGAAPPPPESESKDSDRKRMMADMHSTASTDGAKRRKRRWGDESDKANVKAVIPQGLTADQQKAYVSLTSLSCSCMSSAFISFLRYLDARHPMSLSSKKKLIRNYLDHI